MPKATTATRFPFTEDRIKKWPDLEDGRVRLKDTTQPGLSCYITPTARTFYYRCKVNGRNVEVRLGVFPAISVMQARKIAKDIAPDPAKAADTRKAIREESTLADLWEWFDRHHVAHLRESSARRYRDSWRLHISPPLGKKRLSAIKRNDVQAMLDHVAKESGNGAGRHACAVLSAMYHAATKDDALQYRGDIPTRGTRRPKVASRARFLQSGELPAFLQALAKEPEPWKLFWTSCLFVGLRRANVASARWADLALDIGQWLVPEERSKTGTLLAIPIPSPVLAQLKDWKAELPKRLLEVNEARRRLLVRGDAGVRERQPLLTEAELAEAGEFVFPSALVSDKPTKSPHIVDPKASWRRVLKAANLTNLRPHDLRRSIGSWMALGGVGLPIIGAALGHKDQKSTVIYARLNDSAVRAAMERATTAMLEAGGGQ